VLFSDRAKTADPFQNIVTPHVVARVLLDGSSFPPVLLHRRVAVNGASGVNAEFFRVGTVTLHEPESFSAMGGQEGTSGTAV
jgi:hypothetical protein